MLSNLQEWNKSSSCLRSKIVHRPQLKRFNGFIMFYSPSAAAPTRFRQRPPPNRDAASQHFWCSRCNMDRNVLRKPVRLQVTRASVVSSDAGGYSAPWAQPTFTAGWTAPKGLKTRAVTAFTLYCLPPTCADTQEHLDFTVYVHVGAEAPTHMHTQAYNGDGMKEEGRHLCNYAYLSN